MPVSAAAALLGATDTASFLVLRPRLFRESPGRALGSVGLLALWLSAAAGAGRRDGRTMVMAFALAAANTGLLAAHLRARILKPRICVGPALSAVVLAGSLRRPA